MPAHDRDYMQRRPRPPGAPWREAPVVVALLAVNLPVYLAGFSEAGAATLEERLALRPWAPAGPWKLLTASFAHHDGLQLLVTGLFLYWCGWARLLGGGHGRARPGGAGLPAAGERRAAGGGVG